MAFLDRISKFYDWMLSKGGKVIFSKKYLCYVICIIKEREKHQQEQIKIIIILSVLLYSPFLTIPKILSSFTRMYPC
jgi:hypothetical protein